MALPPPSATSTALVTGASSGIGAEIAAELARRGHGVTLVARREDKLRELADRLAQEHDVRGEVIAADLTDEESRGNLLPEIEGRGLTVDILVNNAGFTTMGAVHQASRQGEMAMIRTDIEAVVDLCTIFLPGMVSRGRGAVLNTASTAAFQPLPGQAGYAASKAFVLSYSRAVSAELKGTGVTITALCPGPVETGFAEASGLSDEEAADSLPKIMWVPAKTVAKTAVDALSDGRQVVIPGAVNRISAQFAHHAPKAMLLPFLARQHPALKKAKS